MDGCGDSTALRDGTLSLGDRWEGAEFICCGLDLADGEFLAEFEVLCRISSEGMTRSGPVADFPFDLEDRLTRLLGIDESESEADEWPLLAQLISLSSPSTHDSPSCDFAARVMALLGGICGYIARGTQVARLNTDLYPTLG
jgi:hypothetical protein